jgi:hypothetical protein
MMEQYCIQSCPETHSTIGRDGRTCLKPSGPLLFTGEETYDNVACPDGMKETDNGEECIRPTKDPLLTNPSCMAGYTRDPLTSYCVPVCNAGFRSFQDICIKDCDASYYTRCGSLCLFENTLCTQELVDLGNASIKDKGGREALVDQAKAVMDNEAAVCN